MTGCELMGMEDEISLNSDCLGAMAAVEGRNRDIGRVIGEWRPQGHIRIKKVKAHPDRKTGAWTKEDKGIWAADDVAGGDEKGMECIRASDTLKRIADRQVSLMRREDRSLATSGRGAATRGGRDI